MKTLTSALVLGVTLALTSCGASKHLGKTNTTVPAAQNTVATLAREVAANAQTESNVTAKISADINAAGKEISLGGSLRMRRNEVIQLQLTFLGITEVGRIEFTPTEVLIINRVQKEFVRAKYDQLSFLKQAGLDFYALQSLFWGELFVPGEKSVANALDRFTVSSAGNSAVLMPKDTPKLQYAFTASLASKLLSMLDVRPSAGNSNARFTTTYGDYARLGGKFFPGKIVLNATGVGKDFSLGLTLSRLSNDAGWEPHTTPSSKYTERTAEEVFRKLLTL